MGNEVASKALTPGRDQQHRILLLHPGGGLGGAPLSMVYLAAHLDRDRYEPLVILTGDGPVREICQRYGVACRVVPLRSTFNYAAHVKFRLRMLVNFSYHLLPTIRDTTNLARKVQPDLIHLNTTSLLPAAWAFRQLGLPIVWHAREITGRETWLKSLKLDIIELLATRIIATSEAVSRQYRNQQKVVRIYNAVDLERFNEDALSQRDDVRRRFGIPLNAPVVGIVGSVQHPKGHFTLLEAFQNVLVELPEARLMVVAGGVGPEYARSWKGRVKRALNKPFDLLEAMQRDAARRGLADRVVYTGYQLDMPRMYAAMDVLAFPVLKPEGFGRPLIEAMAMRRPVVASDIGPSAEIVQDGVTGCLVPPGDMDALAGAIITLLTDQEKASAMGRAGRHQVETRFNMTDHVAAVQRVYEEVLTLT